MPDDIPPQTPSRRRFIGVAAAAAVAGSLSQLAFAETNQSIAEVAQSSGGDKTAIRRLRVHAPESQLIDLKSKAADYRQALTAAQSKADADTHYLASLDAELAAQKAQLLLMFVIMVGQQVIGRSADKRSAQTYLNAEAVLRSCERLQAHLRAQDLAIRHVVEHVQRGS